MIRDRVKELRRVPARDLIPHAKNWRRHPKRQQEALAAVLEEVGYADALIAREDDDGRLHLIDGHLRADVSADTVVPVLILDVDENEADKVLATLDPLAGMAEMDLIALKDLAAGIQFDVPEFGELLNAIAPADHKTGLTDENAAPAAEDAPVSRLGDLWTLGGHRLLCGNSTVAAEVERLFGGVTPGLMATDPPYGVNYNPKWREGSLGPSKAGRSVGEVQADDNADWRAAYALFPGDVAYVWHAGTKSSVVAEGLEECGFQIRSQIVWIKQHFVISRGHYHVQHEPCWYAVRKGGTGHWAGDRKQTTVWQVSNRSAFGGAQDDASTKHSTQKPVEVMRRPILNHTNPGQSVYDPFLGSGTTLIAAETTGRVCFAIDIDPAYVDVAVKRWQDFTGKEAVLDADGRTFAEVQAARTRDPETAEDFQRGRQRIADRAEAAE